MKISGTPLWDPEIGSPFAILHEPALMKKLPRVRRRASVITGSVAAPYISEVLSARGCNVPGHPGKKEIACLITIDDLKELDLHASNRPSSSRAGPLSMMQKHKK